MISAHAEGQFQPIKMAFAKVDGVWRKGSWYANVHGSWRCVFDNKIIMMPQRYVATGVHDVCASAA